MKARSRSFVLLVVLLSATAAGVLWWQALRSQALLRQQVLLQADQRSLHVAGAMAGQVQAQLGMLDMALKELRQQWRPETARRFDALAGDTLSSLPAGFVSHLTVINAEGYVVYNSLGRDPGLYVGDRGYFTGLRTGGDRLLVSAPVLSRFLGQWAFTVSRPILRGGRFEGVVNLVVRSSYMAERLGALELSDQDVVSLVHPDGHYLARSRNNDASMNAQVPADRPFRRDPAPTQGTYRVEDVMDHAPRTYGWHRLPGSGLVVSVGLADDTVLAPLVPALRRNLVATGLLSLLLLGFGGVIARSQLQAARSQRALAAREAQLKEAQQLARLGSWTHDVASGEVKWSDEVFRIFEMDPALTHPSYERFLQWVHPDDRAQVQHEYEASVQARKPYNHVHRLQFPGGRVKYVRQQGVTEYEGERPLRSLGTVQDITEVRMARLALQQLNEQLEIRVTDRTRELAQANRELEAFTYSVSHDLRTPLRSIHGFACVLEEEEGAQLSEAGRKHLRRIQDGSRRMGQLITDLLSLAHLSRARMHQEPVDLSELALQVAGELQRAEPGREVDWHIQDQLQAMADPGLIRVVLQNLLGNAWKYTGQASRARISFTQETQADGMTTFCVRDNGAGFDMAYAAQLFQPFKRLHAHHEFEGSGVGLATVSRVIRRQGGHVRGEGAVGRGAAFFFTLPEVAVTSDLTTW
ncbi:ATP-binding protein [Hydrogenophaga sp. MI9]|uniref:ATP-binding protein n=1 Tax=Hydrogenophaga sp. MI9 TaxID=3453719 RepID=UPI003EEC97BB